MKPIQRKGAAGSFNIIGAIDCSGNPLFPSANAGYVYLVSGSGYIGGPPAPNAANGQPVSVGDWIVCEVDGTAQGTYTQVGASWTIVTASQNINYTNPTAVPFTLGGITAGETFSNQTMKQMWDNLLYPFQPPQVVLSMVANGILREYGNDVVDPVLTATTTKHDNNIKQVRFFRGATPIYTLNSGTIPPLQFPTGGAEVFNTYSHTISIPEVYTAIVTDTSLYNVTSNVVSYTFCYPIYYGSGLDGKIGTPALLRSDLTHLIATPADRSLNFTPDLITAPRMYYCYPDTGSNLKAIGGVKDSNGFDVTGDWSAGGSPGTPTAVVAIVGLDGTSQNYKVYEFEHDTGNGTQVTYTFDHI